MVGLVYCKCKKCGANFAAGKPTDICKKCSSTFWQYTHAQITGEFYDEYSKLPSSCRLFVVNNKWFWKDKNGLENGPFDTMGKARKDACLALC